MQQQINPPDWSELCSLSHMDNELTDKFLQETVCNNIHFYWTVIVSNKNKDNSEIVDTWERICKSPMMRHDFVDWYSKQTSFKAQGPYYTYKDVLRYLTHKKHSLD